MKGDVSNSDVQQVQLIDLEDASHVPPGKAIMGAQVGNWMWRSPEAHAGGPIEKASDMFSFGIVCTYSVVKGPIFAVEEDESVDKLAIVLEKQISYFAEENTIAEFLRYIGEDNPYHEIFLVIKKGFGDEQPRRPFELWYEEGMDDKDFKDLVRGLTHFDPARRLTSKEALAHKWFADV